MQATKRLQIKEDWREKQSAKSKHLREVHRTIVIKIKIRENKDKRKIKFRRTKRKTKGNKIIHHIIIFHQSVSQRLNDWPMYDSQAMRAKS